MAAALGLDVSYISQLENAKRTVDDWYITKAREIADQQAGIEKSKSDRLAEHSVEYTANRAADIRSKSHRYLDQVLDACHDDLDTLTWTYVELQRHFPVGGDPPAAPDPLSSVAGDTAGKVVAEAARQHMASKQSHHEPKQQSSPPKSSGPERK